MMSHNMATSQPPPRAYPLTAAMTGLQIRLIASQLPRDGQRETDGQREGGWEGGREGGWEGGRVVGRDGGWLGGREGGREGSWEGGRVVGREGGREGGRERGREGDITVS